MSPRKRYIRENFIATMRQQEDPAIHSTPVTPWSNQPFSGYDSGPSHPAFDQLEEMRTKQLEEDCDTLKKGFVKLREKYAQSTTKASTLESELDTCRGESEQLKLQVVKLQDELKMQDKALADRVATAVSVATTVSRKEVHRVTYPCFYCRLRRSPQMADFLSDKVKCIVCFEILNNPHSLDCRHVLCGLCVAGWFASIGESTCPECRTMCVVFPQRDFALRDILPVVYSGLEREVPTVEGLDATLFARIYAMIDECRENMLTDVQRTEFWAPMIAEVRRMQGFVDPPAVPVPVPDPDVEMEGDNTDPNWELGSEVDSQETGNGVSQDSDIEIL